VRDGLAVFVAEVPPREDLKPSLTGRRLVFGLAKTPDKAEREVESPATLETLVTDVVKC
jgi:hypothetical protein